MEYQKTKEAIDDLIGNKIAKKLRKSQEVHHKIIYKHLRRNMINKYLKIVLHLLIA